MLGRLQRQEEEQNLIRQSQTRPHTLKGTSLQQNRQERQREKERKRRFHNMVMLNMIPPRNSAGAISRAESPTGKVYTKEATDETTVSTCNCDDSMTQDSSSPSTATVSKSVRVGVAPPVAAVNVDRTQQHSDVRRRLRDQEAKINHLLHSTSEHAHKDDGVLLKLVRALEEDLQKTRNEKQELEGELVARNGTSEALSEVQTLLTEKTHSLQVLQNRLDSTLERLVSTQLDLETHNLHYTDYAQMQCETGQAALEDMNELTASQDKKTRKLGKRSKQMMTTLLNDLESLGRRYQSQQIQHDDTVFELTQEKERWKHRAESLQKQLEELGQEVVEVDALPVAAKEQPPQPQEHVAVQETLNKLQQQLEAAQAGKQQAEIGKQAMQHEVARLQKSLQQLQHVTVKQQKELEAVKNSQGKKGFWGLKKKKNKVPTFDIQTALAPIQEESNRFEEVQARFESHAARMAQKWEKEVQKSAQMKQELQQLRSEQYKDSTAKETELEIKVAMMEARLAEAQSQREQENAEAQAAQAKLNARINELESSC